MHNNGLLRMLLASRHRMQVFLSAHHYAVRQGGRVCGHSAAGAVPADSSSGAPQAHKNM